MTLYVPERKVWTKQPHGYALTIDPYWAKRGISHAITNGFDYVTGLKLTPNGTTLKPNTSGIGSNAASSSSIGATTPNNVLAKATTKGLGDFTVLAYIDNVTLTNTKSMPANVGCNDTGSTADGAARELYLMINSDSNFTTTAGKCFGVRTNWSGSSTTGNSNAVQIGRPLLFGMRRAGSYAYDIANKDIIQYGPSSKIGTQVVNDNSGSAVIALGGFRSANYGAYFSNNLLFMAFDSALTNNEIYALSDNPWQIFAPRRQWFALSQVTNVRLLYPSSDISTGSWTPSTGTTLYAVLDEAVADNSDYIEAVIPTSCEIKLEAGATPSSRNNHIIRYRLLPGTGILTMTLKCGNTTITSWEHTLTASTQSIENTLTVGEATSITDYSDLRIVATVS